MFIDKGKDCFSYLVQAGYSALDLSSEEVCSLRTKEIVSGNSKVVVLGFLSSSEEISNSISAKVHVLSTEKCEEGFFHIVSSYREQDTSLKNIDSPDKKSHNSLYSTVSKARDLLDKYVKCPSDLSTDELIRVINQFVNRFGKYAELANDKKFVEEYEFLLSLASYSLAVTASMHNLNGLRSKMKRSVAALESSYDKKVLNDGIDEMHQMLDFSWSLKPKDFESYTASEGNEVARSIHRLVEGVGYKTVSVSPNLTPTSCINPRRTYHNNLIYCFQIIFDNAVYWSKENVQIDLIDIEEEGSQFNKALVISNDGEPISQADIPKLFTKTTTKRHYGGNGVGLFIAKMLSKQGGFDIIYDKDNEYGSNTSFVIKYCSR